MRRKTLIVMLALLMLLLGVRPAHAQTVEGSQPTRQQILERLAALEAEIAQLKATLESAAPLASPPAVDPPASPQNTAGLDDVPGLTLGSSLDTYYGYNFNQPVGRVNLLRAYDVSSNSFSLNQANLIIEHAADVSAGNRFGVRLDLQYGQATESSQGNPGNELRPQTYRPIWQAYGTYILP